ncbi:MAG TPA: serine hydrolase domain-containing protein [Feifaniaceae bacterium]|nr:serine hydrolase domain-containing protein [Feifaniaceae bacterium]
MNHQYDPLIDPAFRGCVLITQGGGRIFAHTASFSDLANERPNTLDTRFPTASAGKVFVATAILKLKEQGRLRLSDTLGGTLPYDLHAIDPAVTIEQLLTHTSGIPDYFDESVMDDYSALFLDFPNYKIRVSKDLLPLFWDKPMLYAPGERFQYNNAGYVMLGLIIEALTNMPFDKFLMDAIFHPANMRDTGYYELDRLPKNCASAYIFDEAKNEYYTNIYSVDAKGTGAGGAYTTLEDVERFWHALFNGTLLPPDTVKQMIRPHGMDGDSMYGHGVWLRKYGDAYIPYIQGCDPGVSFLSSYDPVTALCVTLVSNYGDNVWKLNRSILKQIG